MIEIDVFDVVKVVVEDVDGFIIDAFRGDDGFCLFVIFGEFGGDGIVRFWFEYVIVWFVCVYVVVKFGEFVCDFLNFIFI